MNSLGNIFRPSLALRATLAVGISVGVVGLAAVFAWPVINHFHVVEHSQVRIEHRERERRSDGDMYMVYTTAGVFQNSDSLLDFKFNSADVQSRLTPGLTCDLITRGYRVPFFSLFPNIVEARC